MPRKYQNGGRERPGTIERPMERTVARTLKERLGALRNLGPFVSMVWRTAWPPAAKVRS